jgi:hypothetical protein
MDTPSRQTKSTLEFSPSDPTYRRSRLWALSGVFIITLLYLPLFSNGAVRFDMFVGYDGIVPQGSWFPITFEVHNDGPSFNAELEISPGQFNSSQTRTMVIELPTGTTKRFVMPAFTAGNYNPGWNARLLDGAGKVRAETAGQRIRRLNESAIPLSAALSRSLPPLPQFKTRQDELRPIFGRLQPSVFPDHPITLEGLDTLYLSSERAMELKVNQVGSLIAWLYNGGHLIVGLEQINHLSGPGEWLRQLLPCEATGMASLRLHPELQEWVASRRRIDGSDYDFSETIKSGKSPSVGSGNPYARLEPELKFEEMSLQVMTVRLRDGRVLIGPETSPLAIISNRGRGQITVLTFAPELEPFRSWKNADHFWAKAIDIPPDLLTSETVSRYPGRPIDGIFGALVDSKQVRKLPVGWLLLLLVAYLVVIGPLDQYWLKKLNRQMLTWLTFPAYVAFFSLLIYFIGYKLRAGETEWNELHVVDIMPHGKTADLRGRSFGSIYSPVNARYTFASDLPFATFRGEFSGNYSGGQEAGRTSIEQRPTGFRAIASVPVWTSQLFVSDWWRQETPPITLTVDNDQIVVENKTDAPIKEARLVIHGQVLELGSVSAGERKSFSRFASPGMTLKNFVHSHVESFANVVQSRQQAFGDSSRGEVKDIPGAAMAASFVTLNNTANNYNNFNPPSGFDLSHLVQRGEALLLAWMPDHSFTKPLNQFSTRRGKRATLVRVTAKVEAINSIPN